MPVKEEENNCFGFGVSFPIRKAVKGVTLKSKVQIADTNGVDHHKLTATLTT